MEVTVCDRSTEYGGAAAFGAPKAVQVADRWHLLANMRKALERWLHTIHARLRPQAPTRLGGATLPPCRDQAFRSTGPERAAQPEQPERWRTRDEQVRQRHLAGEPLMAIAPATGLARGSVRKFAYAESFPAHLPNGPGPNILD